MFDGKAFGQEVVAAVKAHVDKSLAPILARLDALEQTIAAQPAPKDGVSVTVEDVAPMIQSAIDKVAGDVARAIPEMIQAAMAVLPDPEPAKSVDPAEVKAMVDQAVAARPVPKDGESIDPEHVAGLIKSEAERILAGWDKPQDGKSVTVDELAPVVAECVQKAMEAIPAPKDGCGIKELLIDREGSLVATMDDGRMKNLGRVVGKDGIDVDMPALERRASEMIAALPKPKDGKDGFSLKDFDASLMDDGRTVLLSFADDERSFKVELGFAIPLDRGVYKEDGTYSKGDGVTWGGCFWIAQVDNPEGKPDSGKGWRMAVKKGRDGKDFVPKSDNGQPKVKV